MMIFPFGKQEKKKFFNDIGTAIIISLPLLLLLLYMHLFWLRIFFSVLFGFSLIFVGHAIGKSLFTEDGELSLSFKGFPRFIPILLTAIAATLSAISTISDKVYMLQSFLIKIFR